MTPSVGQDGVLHLRKWHIMSSHGLSLYRAYSGSQDDEKEVYQGGSLNIHAQTVFGNCIVTSVPVRETMSPADQR